MAKMGRHQGTMKRSVVPGGEQGRWPSGLEWTPTRGWGEEGALHGRLGVGAILCLLVIEPMGPHYTELENFEF
jgi:hypothetical protein